MKFTAFFLYNAVLLLLLPLYRLLALFHPELRKFQKTRESGWRKLREFISTADLCGKRIFWLHASSAGEFDQALGLLREIRRREKKSIVIVSVFSLSVKRDDHPEADLFFHMPLDLPWTWGRLLGDFRPDFFITMTWDVFPNLLRKLKSAGSACFLCSAALSPESIRFRKIFLELSRPAYELFSGIGCADEENRKLFLRILPRHDLVKNTGDSRFDTIFYKIKETKLTGDAARLLSRKFGPFFILASTYSACDSEIFPHLPGMLARNPAWKLLLFPHHVDSSRLQEIREGLKKFGLSCENLSDLKNISRNRIILVDRLGILALAYQRAELCYVGGAFHHRVHNTAEGAALGLPVITGPRIDASPIAVELEKEGVLLRCRTGAQIIAAAEKWMRNSSELKRISKKTKSILLRKKGASAQFYDAFLR